MGYAIEIIFDSKSERQIIHLMKNLDANEIENCLRKFQTTPHIALSVSDEIDIEKTIGIIERINISQFTIPLYGLGTFQGINNIIFLLPKVTMELLAFQKTLHCQLLKYSDSWNYYYPDNWVPHCTVAMDIAEDQFLNAFRILRDNMEPISARVEKIRLIKFHPEEILYERLIEK